MAFAREIFQQIKNHIRFQQAEKEKGSHYTILGSTLVRINNGWRDRCKETFSKANGGIPDSSRARAGLWNEVNLRYDSHPSYVKVVRQAFRLFKLGRDKADAMK